MATYSVNWSAVLSSLAGAVAMGQGLVNSTSGYLPGTTANRGTKRCSGIAAIAGNSGEAIAMIEAGVIPPTISGLSAGTQSWVRISATGTIERCTPGVGDDIIGKAEADGSVHLHFGVFDSTNTSGGGGGGGGATLPIVLTTDVSGTLPEANGGTGITSLATGMATWWGSGTSANLRSAMTDPTGTAGRVVFSGSPTLSTPKINNTGATFTYDFAVSALAANRTITLPLLTGNDTFVFNDFAATLTNKTIAGASNTLTVRIANDVTGLGTNVAAFLATPSGANLASALTSALPDTKGGTGLTALGTGVATFLGTPSGANLASALTTALPATKGGTGLTSLGTNVATFLGTPSSANLIAALLTSTGTGAGVFGTSPTLTTPVINGQTQGAAVAISLLAIDWALGTVFTKTLSAGGNTFTFSNAASGMVITVRLTGAASTVTWPTVKWAGGTPPTQTASGIDVYTFVHDGTSIYGSVVQAMA